MKKDNKEEVKKSEGVPYDPNKRYQWQRDHIFSLTGEEYGQILHSLRLTLSSREAQVIMAAEKANIIIDNLLKKAVESGEAKEIVEDEQETLKVSR